MSETDLSIDALAQPKKSRDYWLDSLQHQHASGGVGDGNMVNTLFFAHTRTASREGRPFQPFPNR